MAHALIHVLGSRAGYTTLDATPGVSTGERAELEILSFGDATNAEAMSRLETSASMIGRRLRSGRFAISRMLPGGTDDAGRPTIEVISLIVDSAAYAAVVGAIHRLAADVRFWRLARASVSRGYALPEEAVRSAPNDPQVLRAYDGWVAARRQGGTAVLGDADAAGLFAMVALLDAQDLGECRWGVGVLSLSAPVDVCTLAPTAASIGPRPVLRVAPGAAWLNREMEFASLHAARNRLLPPSAALATAVRIEPALDRSAIAVPVGEPDGRGSEFSRRPRNLTHIAGVTAAASFALLGVMVVVYARGGGGESPSPILSSGARTPSEGEAPVPPDSSSQGYGAISPILTDPVAPEPAVRTEATSTEVSYGAPARDVVVDSDADGVPDAEDCDPSDPNYSKRFVLFQDYDADGAGDRSSAQPFCWKQGDVFPPGFVDNSSDECDQNPLRKDAGKCGCDYPRASEDCDEDEDLDGEPNRTDTQDERLAIAGRLKDLFEWAKRALDDARSDRERVEQQIDDHNRIGGSVIKSEDFRDRLSLVRAEIERSLMLVYQAKEMADFGRRITVNKEARRSVAPLVSEVMRSSDFEAYRDFLGQLPKECGEFVRVWRSVSGKKEQPTLEGWRSRLVEHWKTKEGKPSQSEYIETIGKAVAALMVEEGAQSEINAIGPTVGKAKP